MKTVNALQLRQSLGQALDHLERHGDPILVCRRRMPAAALVSLKDYRASSTGKPTNAGVKWLPDFAD